MASSTTEEVTPGETLSMEAPPPPNEAPTSEASPIETPPIETSPIETSPIEAPPSRAPQNEPRNESSQIEHPTEASPMAQPADSVVLPEQSTGAANEHPSNNSKMVDHRADHRKGAYSRHNNGNKSNSHHQQQRERVTNAAERNDRAGTHVPAVRAEAEKLLGISQRSIPFDLSWTGDIRKRYTDFLVNEMRKDGTVIRLSSFKEPDVSNQDHTREAANKPASQAITKSAERGSADKPPTVTQKLSDTDRDILESLIGKDCAVKLTILDENIQADTIDPKNSTVVFDPITDRNARAHLHQEIRRMFNGRFETVADPTGIITASPSKWNIVRPSNRNKRGGGHGNGTRGGGQGSGRYNNHTRGPKELGFSKLGGEYLHFTMYKENKDTMDAINTIARLLKVKASTFAFAGTKDRRAATVQRISVHRQRENNLIWLNARLPNIKIGDFKHTQHPLQLAQHGGNEFVITLKNCQPLRGAELSLKRRMAMIQECVEFGLGYLNRHGYINYFGLQRFGTYSIGTHIVGMKILNSDFEGAVDDILHVDDATVQQVIAHSGNNEALNARDEYNRARAIFIWRATRNADKALEVMPKRYSSEVAIIRHLARSPRDFQGALLTITRGMRMLYVHAYQSYVWNFVASRRWAEHGSQVIEGDLVLINEAGPRLAPATDELNGQDTVLELNEDQYFAEARHLTAEDVASGKYTIFDIVLPTPGWDVLYPNNEIGKFYEEFMGRTENGGLDPHNMRRLIKEFSLSGNYRTLMGRFITEPTYHIQSYVDDMAQLHPTDLDYCLESKTKALGAKLKAEATSAPESASVLTEVKPASESNPTSDWVAFSHTAADRDRALAEERRRKAPASTSWEPARMNDTWIQTGLDGSSKRVKIARHEADFDEPSTPGARNTNSGSAVCIGLSGLPVNIEDVEMSGTVDSATKAILDELASKPTPISARTPMGFSDDFMRAAGFDPFGSPDRFQDFTGHQLESTPTKIRQSIVDDKTIGELFDKHIGASEKMPVATSEDISMVSSSSSATPTGGLSSFSSTLATFNSNAAQYRQPRSRSPTPPKNGTHNPADDAGKAINGIPVPQFYKVSSNPVDRIENPAKQTKDEKAQKVAVILKFQLRASNYATVVLRELMGSAFDVVADGSADRSRAE